MSFQVQRVEAENFGKIWTYRGISVPLTEADYQFATDFANVVLRNFINMCQESAKDAQANRKEIERKLNIIMEGIS